MSIPPFRLVGRTTLQIERRGPGFYQDGYWVEAPVETNYGNSYGWGYGGPVDEFASGTFDIVANVQPGLKWNDLQMLPEGERGRRSLRVYTTFPLRTRREGPGGWDADRFVWTDGHTYEVNLLCHDYQMGPLSHTKAICARIEVT